MTDIPTDDKEALHGHGHSRYPANVASDQLGHGPCITTTMTAAVAGELGKPGWQRLSLEL
jgi:hypothetical protein